MQKKPQNNNLILIFRGSSKQITTGMIIPLLNLSN